MTENVSIVGKDYHTVAMENAYKLAQDFVYNESYDNKTRMIIVAKLTNILYFHMIGYRDITPEVVSEILGSKY